MPNILIVGATRGLGASLTKQYASNSQNKVYCTTRSEQTPTSPKAENILWVPNIDLTSKTSALNLSAYLSSNKFSVVIITAGVFVTESFDTPDWDAEVRMYTTSSIAPVFVVQQLVKGGCLGEGSKVILVSSESGSIALRHEKEGGGNYAHHASKAALNMVGKLLSLDLKSMGVAVGMVHPGFMRTEMTRGVGFDKFWDEGGGMYLGPFPVFVSFLPVLSCLLPALY